MLDWMDEHRGLMIMAGVSVAVMILCVVFVGIVLVRVPVDYFASEKEAADNSPGLRLVRSIAGWILILAGLAMLVLPGPGFLVVLIGVMLAEFPGKFRVQRWIISRKQILRAANGLRKRFGKPALKVAGKGK